MYIVHYANKAGWRQGKLYFEARRPMPIEEPVSPLNYSEASQVIRDKDQKNQAVTNWRLVHKITAQRPGIPIVIGHLKN